MRRIALNNGGFAESCRTREEENGDRFCGFEVPDDSGNRPVFAPETREQNVPKRAEGDKRCLY
jgi:hypothetical protein